MSYLSSANQLYFNHLILLLSYFRGTSQLPVPVGPPLGQGLRPVSQGQIQRRLLRRHQQPHQGRIRRAWGAAGWGPPCHAQHAPLWRPRPAQRWKKAVCTTRYVLFPNFHPSAETVIKINTCFLNTIFSTHYNACNFKRNFFKQNWTPASMSQLEQNFSFSSN